MSQCLQSGLPRRRGALILGAAICATLAGRPRLPGLTAVGMSGHKVIVVRHGETDWNRALRVQGTTDIPLNDRGRAQAAACAQALTRDLLPSQVPSVVYSSQLQRAAATASAIAASLATTSTENKQVEVNHDSRLNEWDLGVIEGLRKDEAAVRHADDWRIFSQWCSARVAPETASRPVMGGESMDDVRRRVVACLAEACRNTAPDVPVIAVTHGGVLGQLLRHAEQGLSDEEAMVIEPATNACISSFLVAPSGEWRILSWARTDHLSGNSAPASVDYDNSADECPISES